MTLDSSNVESCRRLIARGQAPRATLSLFKSFTLPGAMELFMSAMEHASSSNLLHEMRGLARESHPVLSPLLSEFGRCGEPHGTDDIHGIRSLEFFRIRDAASITGTDFQLFQERMTRSMRQAGFGKDFSLALAHVFFEMADNVNQHSGLAAPNDLTGLAGYHVAEGYIALCVADRGIGALESLRSSSAWKHLLSASAALRAIILDHASRREGQGEGEGFKQVLRALTDRSTALRLRSDDAAVTLHPREHQREAVFTTSPHLSGLLVNLVCDLKLQPKERAISFSS